MTDIYHITHVQNLESIIRFGGLFCDRVAAEQRLQSIGIAHSHIKERRSRRRVPTSRRGTLADYVPFYFAPRSPMLYSIHGGYVEQFRDGQGRVLHLVSNAEAVQAAGRAFTFTEGHGVIAYSQFYEDLADLEKVDWAVMRSTWWNDTVEDMDRKRRRQAEFLVYEFFPWSLVWKIGVMDNGMVHKVNRILEGATHRPQVAVERSWYY